MTRPCSQTYDLYPRLLGLIFHPDPFKLRLDKFNVIINVINIILAWDVAAKLKTLRYNSVKTPNIFRS
jgi:hypothetical protein